MTRFLSLGLVFLLAACAARSVPWVNPSVPKEQWGRDYAACRRSADREVGWRDDGRDADSPFRDYDRHQARKAYDSSLALCMTDLGYARAKE